MPQIIACQYDMNWEDKQANFDRIRDLLQDVEIQPGALIILPEMFSTGFSMNVRRICEGTERPSEMFLADLAVRHAATVMGGVTTELPDARGKNEAVIFDPAGQSLARYSKIHTFTLGSETDHYEQGSQILTFNWAEFTVAPFICYDLRFPEIFRHAAHKNATLMTVIASWPAPRINHWISLLIARAIENQCYIVGVNRCGSDPTYQYCGRSMIIAPSGQIIADAGEDQTAITANVTPITVDEYRGELPFINDMRPEYIGKNAGIKG